MKLIAALVFSTLSAAALAIGMPAPEPKMDLLIVVDDSGSMADEQDRLGHELPALVGDLFDVDWQIAVVTTSSPCLRMGRAVKKSDPDASEAFRAMVAVGTNGQAEEHGLTTAQEALQGKCPSGTGKSWLRSEAALAVLFVSDEDSVDGEPRQLIELMRSLHPASKLRAYGLIDKDAPRYREVITVLGGAVGAISDPEYSRFLSVVSQDLRHTVN